jgi:hypothetical protein
LAHTTLAHTDFSGRPSAAEEAIEALEDSAATDDLEGRRLASLLILETVGHVDASTRAGQAIEQAVHPYLIDHPFSTLGGFADVLDALAYRAPGLVVAHGLGSELNDEVLDLWRQQAKAVHAGVRSADLARYDGFVVAQTSGPVESAARVIRDFRSPEALVIAIGEGEAGIAAVDQPVAEIVAQAATDIGGSALGRATRSYARFEPGQEEAFIASLREAL